MLDIKLSEKWYMRFSLRQLEVFVATGRNASVSQAAKELGLSQSAASTALAELERQFDLRLFDRIGKRLQLNELGHALLPQAIELLDRGQAIEAVLSGDDAIGPLRVGATLTIGNYLATLLMGQFMRRHPDCRAHLELGNTATITERVARFELDLGLIEGDCQHPQIEVSPWVADELVIFAAPEHPLARQATVTEDDLLQVPWVVREPGSGTRQCFDHGLRGKLSQLHILFELEHIEAIKRVVGSGLALSCVSRLALQESFRRGSLVPIEVAGLDFRRHFNFIVHKQKFRTPGMLAFLDLCRAASTDVTMSHEIDLASIDGALRKWNSASEA